MSKIPNIPEMTTLSECMQILKKEGYTHEFDIKDGKLSDPYMENDFTPEEISIDTYYRFEGESNPSDSAILYAITTNNGEKGTLVDAYGTYADDLTGQFFQKVDAIAKRIRK